MSDVGLVQNSSNNGTVTPATPGSLTTTNHNLLMLVVAVLGTSPTIATPASWTQVQKTSGAALTVAMYIFPNNPGGATNPSATLGGTVTGWVAQQFEFNVTGAGESLLNSAQSALAVAQLANVFSGFAQSPQPLLFLYAVARATATLQSQNSGINWSNSVNPLAGVQGLSLDFFWGTNLNNQYGSTFLIGVPSAMYGPPYASASGVLSSAVNSVAIGAMLNSAASQNTVNDIVSGNPGQLVGAFMPGMIGG